MKLPIRFTTGAQGYYMQGYRCIYRLGTPIYETWTEKGRVCGQLNYKGVKLQVFVSEWLYFLPTIPEMLWQRMLAHFWLDRLSHQYECGRADGLREAYESYEALQSLTDGERQALFAQPVSQQEHEAEMKQATK